MTPVFYSWVAGLWVLTAIVTFFFLHFLTAPYGRHARKGWGPSLHRTAGWVVMELPAVLTILFFFWISERRSDGVSIVFLLLWMVHYVNRALIYPFRLRGGQLQMPIMIAAMGFFFNVVNGYLQGYGLFTLGPLRDASWFWDPRFLVGVFVFGFGYWLNQNSDAILRKLRESQAGYQIPSGNGYRFVSCPNYLGELIEWLGWALLTWSVPGVLFFLWTAANLIPRARSHDRWYRRTFTDYPKDRKAIIPYLY